MFCNFAFLFWFWHMHQHLDKAKQKVLKWFHGGDTNTFAYLPACYCAVSKFLEFSNIRRSLQLAGITDSAREGPTTLAFALSSTRFEWVCSILPILNTFFYVDLVDLWSCWSRWFRISRWSRLWGNHRIIVWDVTD